MYQAPATLAPVTSEVPERRRRRGILAVLLGLTVVSLGAGMFSLALFTDQRRSTGSFATGTLDLDVDPRRHAHHHRHGPG